MFGGADDDRLAGNLGDDVLIGELGADTFVSGANQGFDVIFDFNQAEGDKLFFAGFSALDVLNSATQIAIDFTAIDSTATAPSGTNVVGVETLFDPGLLDDLVAYAPEATDTATFLSVAGTVVVLMGIAQSELSINAFA